MDIGKRIKQERKNKKLTQEELADIIGVSGISIRKYESEDRKPSLEILLKISDVLDIPIKELGIEENIINVLPKIPKDVKNMFPSPGSYTGDRIHDPVKEFNLVNDECSDEEKKIIYELLQHYNCRYCDNRYDLSKLDDEHYKDLKIMFYNTMKVVLKGL